MRSVSTFTLGLALIVCASGNSLKQHASNYQQKHHQQPFYHQQLNHGRHQRPNHAQLQPPKPFGSVDCSVPSNQVFLHPHPTDCTLYIQCVHGAPLERPCAPGTEFGPAYGVCVHPWQSGCTAGQDEPEALPKPEPEEIEKPDEAPEEADEVEPETTPWLETDETWAPEIVTDEPANLREPFDVTRICESEPSRIFLTADPNECTQFVVCSVGDAMVRSCAPEQHFDGLTAQCLPGPCAA